MQQPAEFAEIESGVAEEADAALTALQGGGRRLIDLLTIHRFRRASAMLLLVTAGLLMLSYWPGILTWDPIEQYDQANLGVYEDWHPPIMAWIWHWLIPIAEGTGPMFVLQLLLYLGGHALLTGWALKRGRPAMAFAFAVCATMPIGMALMGSVLKDSLMTGALLSGTALALWRTESRNWLLPILSLILLLLATALRFNALPATLPLIVWLAPRAWRQGPVRLAAVSAVALIGLLALPPLINRALNSTKTGVEYTQVIFDLAGITNHSGVDVFPAMPVADPIAISRKCYIPEMWDTFSSWDEPANCAINFNGVRAAFAASGQNPMVYWLRTIAAHPLAYAAHRFEHLKINLRVVPATVNFKPAPDVSIENGWNIDFHPNPVMRWVNWAAVVADHTPLGWPICWLALAAGVMALLPILPSRRLILPIGLSVILYGLSYAVISVASDLRYHLWTMVGTAIILVLAAGDLARLKTLPVKRLILSGAPFGVATAVCMIARFG